MSGETTLLQNNELIDNNDAGIALAPQTCLKRQYIIKKMIFQSKHFIGYLAFDEIIKSNVIIKEAKATKIRGNHEELVFMCITLKLYM